MFNEIFPTDPHPSPDLTPEDVIKIQLEALQFNDISPNDRGIRIVFRFASPANQAVTGPIDKFIELVKNPLYQPMIGFEEAELDPVEVKGNDATGRVRLRYRQMWRFGYLFTLSRQHEPPYNGCWMTDGVLRVG